MKQLISWWYPKLIALLFAAIFAFVIVKYISQVKRDDEIPQSPFTAEENEVSVLLRAY